VSETINIEHNRPDPSPSLDRIEDLGIVGAGGGGFPTAIKLRTQVSIVIANGAECEPLLHKDKELLHHHPDLFLHGLQMTMQHAGAPAVPVVRTGDRVCVGDLVAAPEPGKLAARAKDDVRRGSRPVRQRHDADQSAARRRKTPNLLRKTKV